MSLSIQFNNWFLRGDIFFKSCNETDLFLFFCQLLITKLRLPMRKLRQGVEFIAADKYFHNIQRILITDKYFKNIRRILNTDHRQTLSKHMENTDHRQILSQHTENTDHIQTLSHYIENTDHTTFVYFHKVFSNL